jgi:hypothetical protein
MKYTIFKGFGSWILVDGWLMEELISLLHKLAQVNAAKDLVVSVPTLYRWLSLEGL